jgi:hypothetical protein
MKTINQFTKALLTGILIFTFIAVHAQDYRTIRVNGTIVHEKTNTPLESGTVFEEDDNLIFQSYNSIATVINSQKGRLILKPDNTDLAYAKASYTPAMSNISSRSGAFMTALDLKNHMDGKYVFYDEMILQINPDIFPMNEDKYFFLRYNYNGDTINKKLAFSNDTLFIVSADVFSIDATPVDNSKIETVELWYMQRDLGNKITLLSSFIPVIIDNEQLKNELAIIFEVYADRPEEEKISEAISFIHEFYGTSNQENFSKWLHANMNK